MTDMVSRSLRVLVANERQDRLDVVAAVVAAAGHTVIARSVGIASVAEATRGETPDIAIVAVGESEEHALELVAQLVEESVCPVIVLLERSDPEFVAEAARLGVFGHLSDADPAELASAIEVAFRRFEELRTLREAFDRRAIVERAKGVLMERHGIGEREAFETLRNDARAARRRVADAAAELLSDMRGATEREVRPTA